MSSTYQLMVNDEVDFRAVWTLVWAHKVLIGAIAVVFTIAAVILALVTEPIYRADTVVTEVREDMSSAASFVDQFGSLASLAGVNLGNDGPGREAQTFLQSRRLVEEFIRKYELLPMLSKGQKKSPTMWRAVNKFRGAILSIREDKRKGTTTVSMSWDDPDVAAQWANDFITLLNESMRQRAVDEATRNIEFLNGQLAATDVVEVRRAMYSLIEKETKTLMLANARKEYAFEVVDPAVVPEERISPRRTLLVIFGAMVGALVGIVAAFVRNAIRRSRSVG